MTWWQLIPLTVVAIDLAVLFALWRKGPSMDDEWQEVKDESRVSVRPRFIFLYGLAGMVSGMMQAGLTLEQAWNHVHHLYGQEVDTPELLMLEAQGAVAALSAIIDEHGVAK